MGSHLNTDLSESPGADVTAVASPAVLYLIAKSGFPLRVVMLNDMDIRKHLKSQVSQVKGRKTGGF